MRIRPNLLGLFAALLHRQRDAVQGAELVRPQNLISANGALIEERRASPRRYGDPIEVHLRSYENQVPACGPKGWVRDRSAGGLGLTTEMPIDVGAWLKVRPTTVPDDVAWVDVLARHCRAQGSRWVLGCQFVEPPPRELLVLFR
jgi:hypothetical protein